MNMTVKEFTKKIAQTEFSEEINKISLSINLPHINYEVELNGLSSVYEYYLNQYNGWREITNIPNDLNTSFNFFKKHYDLIFALDNQFNSKENFISHWSSIKNSINKISKESYTPEISKMGHYKLKSITVFI